MRKTLHLHAEDPANISRAARILRGGGLVAFPTETVYGLGADALSADAVAGIFLAKSRPSWDPLIVHVADQARVAKVATVRGELAERVRVLAEAFWPGPLTLLLPRTGAVPDAVTAGRALVGVRVPSSAAALDLLRAVDLPLAAPSANRFGHVSPTTAEHVLADLDGAIDAVLDDGPCPVGVESTVLDPEAMVVYRAGAVTAAAIEQVTGAAVTMFLPGAYVEKPESLPSPGVGLRHYAPEAPLRLTAGGPAALWGVVEELRAAGERVGLLLPGDWVRRATDGVVVERWGRWADEGSLAAGLFAGLRSLEDARVSVMVCPLPQPGGLRDALRDRLMKAAKAR